MLLKSNYCALTAPPKLALYLFSQNLPSLNLQYSKFSKKPTSSQHMYPMGTYFYTRGRIIRLDELGKTFVIHLVIRL